MKLINPIEVTPSKITSYNVTQDVALWSSTTTYSINQVVRIDALGLIAYKSLINSNINQNPSSSPTAWVLIGATNYASMFDAVNGTTTKRIDSISLTILTSELITAVGLIGVVGNTVRLTMTDTVAGTVYDKTINLKTLPAYDWYTFFFGDIITDNVAIFDDLPPYRNAQISVTVTSETVGSYAEVGTIQFGKLEQIGFSRWGFKSNFVDYSRKEADGFGNYTIVKRANAKTLEASVEVDTSRLSAIERLREKLAATPVFWIGASNHAITAGFGFFDQFDIDLSNQVKSDVSIRIVTLT